MRVHEPSDHTTGPHASPDPLHFRAGPAHQGGCHSDATRGATPRQQSAEPGAPGLSHPASACGAAGARGTSVTRCPPDSPRPASQPRGGNAHPSFSQAGKTLTTSHSLPAAPTVCSCVLGKYNICICVLFHECCNKRLK